MADEAVSDAAISSPEVAAVGGDKQTTTATEPEKKVTMARLNFSEECGGEGEEEEGSGSDSDSPEDEEELLFPGFVAKSLRYLPQTNKLRFICLKIITWTYPFINKYFFFRFKIILFQWKYFEQVRGTRRVSHPFYFYCFKCLTVFLRSSILAI